MREQFRRNPNAYCQKVFQSWKQAKQKNFQLFEHMSKEEMSLMIHYLELNIGILEQKAGNTVNFQDKHAAIEMKLCLYSLQTIKYSRASKQRYMTSALKQFDRNEQKAAVEEEVFDESLSLIDQNLMKIESTLLQLNELRKRQSARYYEFRLALVLLYLIAMKFQIQNFAGLVWTTIGILLLLLAASDDVSYCLDTCCNCYSKATKVVSLIKGRLAQPGFEPIRTSFLTTLRAIANQVKEMQGKDPNMATKNQMTEQKIKMNKRIK